MRARRVGVSLAVALVVLVVQAAGEGWLRVVAPPELALPRDHGAHPGYRTEWWYLTALLSDDAGRRFGVQVTFFRQGLEFGEPAPGSSALRARQVVAAHLAVADVAGQRFTTAERVRRAAVGIAGFATDDLEVWVEDWRLERSEGEVLQVTAADREEGLRVDLNLRPQRQLVRHGDRGLSQKGPEPGNASVYLSWTRLEVEGELEVNGRSRTMRGHAWFDHEWGSSQLGAGVVGWDWFSLRLTDGRDLMVYQLRRADGTADPHSSGTLVTADGDTLPLGHNDVELVVLERWTSLDSGADYPSAWRVRVPSAEVDLEVRPLLEAAEVDGRRSTGVVYWEGPVTATGSTTGEGYVELTGYAGDLGGLF